MHRVLFHCISVIIYSDVPVLKTHTHKKIMRLHLNNYVTANMNLNKTIVIMKTDDTWCYDLNPEFLCFLFWHLLNTSHIHVYGIAAYSLYICIS